MKQTIDIQHLSAYTEDNRLEAKRAKGGLPASIWETFSAFANTDGGLILLGVEEADDHSLIVCGVDDAHHLITDFWNTINNPNKVSLNYLTDKMVRVQKADGKEIVVIEVPRADRRHRPIYVGPNPKRGTYRRNFEGDYLCDTDEVAAMFRDASDVTMDQRVLPAMDLDVIDRDTLHRYRNRFTQFHRSHVWNDDDDEVFMRHIGAAALCESDRLFHPTLAGLLMFGREYDIVRECPHYFLDYQEKMSSDSRWTHRMVSTSGDWSGNLYDFFFRVLPRLTADFPVPFVTEGISRIDDTPLHVATREVLLNVCAHADHYGRQGIVIIKSPHEITMTNPGDIRVGLKVALTGGVSDPRNETIMKMFTLVEIGERAGSGIPDFANTWKKYMGALPQFKVTYNPARTSLSMPCFVGENVTDKAKNVTDKAKNVTDKAENVTNKAENVTNKAKNVTNKAKNVTDKAENVTEDNDPNRKVARRRDEILRFMKESPKITIKEISENLNVNKRTILRDVDLLINKGLLKREGSNFGGSWIVLK
jgi:predicted HTH transcriptional regulator